MRTIIENRRELFLCLCAGICTTLTNLLVFYICNNFIFSETNSLNIQISNIIAWFVSVMVAYFFNKYIVFKNDCKNIFVEIIKFYSSRIMTLVLESLIMFIFISCLMADINKVKTFATILILLLNYFINKFIIFK